MKIGLFYFDGFAEFEIVLCCMYLKEQQIISLALEKKEVISLEKQRYLVDKLISEVDADDLDLVIIPGGDSTKLFENEELQKYFEEVSRKSKIAAICGGSELLASLGLLKGKKCTGDTSGITSKSSSYKYYVDSILLDEHVVQDENILTGQGQAFIEFAAELGMFMGIVKSKQEVEQDIKWFMNIRNGRVEEE
jgi:putative intracellular protease/amidase